MRKWLMSLGFLVLLVYCGYRAVGWIERMDAERTQQQEEMARYLAENQAEQVQRSVRHGTTIRTNALREQLQEATQSRESLPIPDNP